MKYTGVRTVYTNSELVDSIFQNKSVDATDIDGPLYPNMSIVLKSENNGSALARVSKCGKKFLLVPNKIAAMAIEPLNKEQKMLMDCLMDDEITLSIITGHAGTGKTICASAVAFHKILEEGKYDYVILTKPMTEVGGGKLGAVPGDLREKFDPFLLSFHTNFEKLFTRDGLEYVRMLEDKGCIRYIPVSVMRGASFSNAFIIADEVQSFDPHQLKTLCTRVGADSKIVLMGDPSQIDTKITWDETGLHKLINSKMIKDSPLTSYIELIKGCRSPLADLIAKVL